MFRRGLYLYLLAMGALIAALVGNAQPVDARSDLAPGYRTITVTTTKDDIQKNGNCTLREAVQAANTNRAVDRCPGGSGSTTDVIKLGKGVYALAIAGRYEHANQKGDIDITQSVTIQGAGRSATLIDGKKLDRVFENRSTGATVTLQDMTIQNGDTQAQGGNIPDDGGAVANKGKLVLTRVRFYQNHAASDEDDVRGGAVFSSGTLTVNDSLFEKNVSGTGGAIGNSGKLKVTHSTFKGNFAYLAGAIFSGRAGASVEISDSLFQANTNGPGGAAVLFQMEGSAATITNSTFEGNTPGDELIANRGTMTVRNCKFQNNQGAPIFTAQAGSLSVTYSTVQNNTAASGSASYGGEVRLSGGKLVLDRMTFSANGGPALVVSGGDARLHNSTLTGLTGDRGVIQVTGGKLAIDMVTIADNSARASEDQAGRTGALYVSGGAVSLHNSILANTRDQPGGAPVADCKVQSGTTTSLGYNLISRAGDCGIRRAKGDQFGSLQKPIDPLLGPLKDNGGLTFTRGLLPGSPAVDRADPVNFFKTDQRTYRRPAGPRADIGAYERKAVP